jgi:hypothetical protein
MSHPSPRLVDGIEQLARALYPAAFAAKAALAGASIWNCSAPVMARSSLSLFAFLQIGGCP